MRYAYTRAHIYSTRNSPTQYYLCICTNKCFICALIIYVSVPMEMKYQTTSTPSASCSSSSAAMSTLTTTTTSVASVEPSTTTAAAAAGTTVNTTATTASMSAVLAALCGGCCGPICDRYIMRVVDTYYHEGCLQCTSCSTRLMHSCFARNGKLYCRIDYER